MDVKVSKKEREKTLIRAQKHLDIFKGAQMIWVEAFPLFQFIWVRFLKNDIFYKNGNLIQFWGGI